MKLNFIHIGEILVLLAFSSKTTLPQLNNPIPALDPSRLPQYFCSNSNTDELANLCCTVTATTTVTTTTTTTITTTEKVAITSGASSETIPGQG